MSNYPVSISPNAELQQKVKIEAKKEKRNFSQQMWHIVELYFNGKKTSKSREGLVG